MVAVCQRPWLARCGSLRLPVWLRLGRDSGNLALSYTQLLPQKILTFSTMCANRGTQLGTLATLPARFIRFGFEIDCTLALAVRQDRDRDSRRAGRAQGLRRFAGRAAGGKNVVHQEHSLVFKFQARPGSERVTDVFAPKSCGLLNLAWGVAYSSQPVCGARQAQTLCQRPRQSLTLIVAS